MTATTLDSGVVGILNASINIFKSQLRQELVVVCESHFMILLDNLIEDVAPLCDCCEHTTIPSDLRTRLEDLRIECYRYSYEYLHLQPWKDIPIVSKRAFALVTIVYVCIDMFDDASQNTGEVIGGIKLCDMGLLLGGGSGHAIAVPVPAPVSVYVHGINTVRSMLYTTLHHQLLALVDILSLSLGNTPPRNVELSCTEHSVKNICPRFPQVDTYSPSTVRNGKHVESNDTNDPDAECGTAKRARIDKSSNCTSARCAGGVGKPKPRIPTCSRTGRCLGSVACVQAEECSLEMFYDNSMLKSPPSTTDPDGGAGSGTPLLIQGAMDHWPAMQPSGERAWADLEYLRRVAGHRLVPVEIGSSHYLGADASQAFMTLNAFIDRYITYSVAPNGSSSNSWPCVGYMAQHQLFEYIPSLRKDICVPDYCMLTTPEDKAFRAAASSCDSAGVNDNNGGSDADSSDADSSVGEATEPEPLVQAWLGPVGTVSPLHHDPYHNLLCQVVGYKYVRIYDYHSNCTTTEDIMTASANAPVSGSGAAGGASVESINRLYPREGALYNNSKVDLLDLCGGDDRGAEWCVDFCACIHSDPSLQLDFPALMDATYIDTILCPGDMLFIPRHAWHYIVALDWSQAEKLLSSGRFGSRHLPPAGVHATGRESVDDFSFSVSFWWGPSIELPH